MANFPNLSNLSSNPTAGSIFTLPNNSYPYFWLWIFAAIWLITGLTLFYNEKERKGVGNLLSSLAVSSFAMIVLATVGSVVGIISLPIMIYILVFCILIIGVWFFSN